MVHGSKFVMLVLVELRIIEEMKRLIGRTPGRLLPKIALVQVYRTVLSGVGNAFSNECFDWLTTCDEKALGRTFSEAMEKVLWDYCIVESSRCGRNLYQGSFTHSRAIPLTCGYIL